MIYGCTSTMANEVSRVVMDDLASLIAMQT